VPVPQIAGCLDHLNHPGSEGLVIHRRAHQLKHRFPRYPGEAAQQLAMVQEVRPQHLRDDEDPLGMADLGEYILRQEPRHRRRPLRRARRTQLPGLAREGEQVLLSAFGTPDPGDAILVETAVEVAHHLLVDDAPPESKAPLETLLPLPLHLVEVRVE